MTPEEQITWLREGLEIALEHLRQGRVGLAISAIMGTLAGEENCW
jgi:hypothetical protein